MQPYSRVRNTREHAEAVHVNVPDLHPRHGPQSAGRKRVGKRSSTLAATLCGGLFVVAVVAVYLYTSRSAVTSSPLNGTPKNEQGTPLPTQETTRPTQETAPPTQETAPPTQETAPPKQETVPPTLQTVRPTQETDLPTQGLRARDNALPSTASPEVFQNPFDENDRRTARPRPEFAEHTEQYEIGEYQPEEPERLPGLTVTRRTYTPEELLQLYGNTDYIYSFVNGSEMNHHYRKASANNCGDTMIELEHQVYQSGGELPPAMQLRLNNNTPACRIKYLKTDLRPGSTVKELFQVISQHVRPTIGDRETDELRHSVRSLEQHVQWHRGRVVIVSPGHHPTWVDGARNFLAGTCGGAAVQALRARGTHLRLTTVHQDAVMPYGIRITTDSHSIEQHIWRVKNITPVHVYMNDDYFVNRDVAITDLFNEYGGTIVRTEAGILKNGVRGPEKGGTWGEGVRHSHLFNIMELDLRHEDYLPTDYTTRWLATHKETTATGGTAIPPIALSAIIDAAHAFQPTEWPKNAKPRRHRRYATHAPFVYCTNMHRYLQTRYAEEFAHQSFIHRGRRGRDVYIPFAYNAFVMARPWAASPKFLPYLLELHHSRLQSPTAAPPSAEIALDNFDSCGQATLRGGRMASECMYGKFLDNTTLNTEMVGRIRAMNPLYFNINAGFGSAEASDQLRQFLHESFPTPVYLEQQQLTSTPDPEEEGVAGDNAEEVEKTTTTTTVVPEESDRLLSSTFDALMQLPVIGLVSYDEGVCPLVRSLSLAFANHHKGSVHVRVQRPGEDDNEQTLRETRKRLRHRVFSAVSAIRCTLSPSVTVAAAAVLDGAATIAATVLSEKGELDSGVELPSTCGAASGTAGLRVRGFVIDARTPNAPVASAVALREALAMPGQTLALEDFRAVHVGPGERDVVLVLARADADAKAVHWITGASENDLLLTYPLPQETYELLDVPAEWVEL